MKDPIPRGRKKIALPSVNSRRISIIPMIIQISN
tara:strand:- start:392 stop:493 length:102 start_codon:yes stop_codon:yes gene_type:complete